MTLFSRPDLPFPIYDLGFSFFSFHRASRPTPETLTTLKRTPGISPFALPLRPNPAIRTSSFSSTKFKQPSLGTILRGRISQHKLSGPLLRSQYSFSRAAVRETQSWGRSWGKVFSIPKAVTFFPFLISCTRTHFRMAELGCLASIPIFSSTIPLAWEEPPKGEDLKAVPRARFLYPRSAHRWSRRWVRSLRAAFRPRGCPLPMIAGKRESKMLADSW